MTLSNASKEIDGLNGWVTVAATFTVLTLSFGAAYSFTAFFPSLEEAFTASREDVSLVFGFSGFLYFMLGAVSGPIADRHGTRPVVLFGVVVAGLGVTAGGYADSLLEIYICFGLGIGVGVGFAYVPAVAAVQRWFMRHRGLAGGMAVAGIGAGTLAGAPLASLLINESSWRGAYLTLGLFLLFGGIAAAIFIDDPPSHRTARKVRRQAGSKGEPLAAILASRPFLLLWLSSFLLSLGLFVPFVHLVPYSIDRGFGAEAGVLLLSLIGLGSTLGRFVLAGFADRIGRRNALVLMYAGVGLMDLVWLWGGSMESLYVFAVVYGLCYGGFVGTAPAVSADYFGTEKLSSVIGCLYTSVAFGTLAGPPLAGRAFDLYQSYDLPILVGFAGGIGGAVLVLLIGKPKPRSSVAD